MQDTAGTDRLQIYTIGHSNHPLESFLELLKAHGIEVLVDTRSSPYSRYAPQYNRENLKASVEERGVRYLFLGEELGGRPQGLEYYDEDGHVLYGRVAESSFFLEGIRRLEKGVRSYRVALLCAEENPQGCHRKLLVSRVLRQRGVSVCHIRGDGRTEDDAEVPPDTAQLSLFQNDEADEWKSTVSVLRREPHPSSSR